LQLFAKPQFDPNGYEKFVTIRKTLNNRQLFALKELWRWRDQLARQADESTFYVLPDHMMIQIAEVLPRLVISLRFSLVFVIQSSYC
jgi:ribonuclease D